MLFPVGTCVLALGQTPQAFQQTPETLRALAQARTMVAAMVAEDYEAAAAATSPRLIRLVGGRPQLLALLRTNTATLKANGIKIQTAEVQEATQLVSTPTLHWVILPTQTRVAMPQGTGYVGAYLLGISEDQGRTWTFTDGSGMTSQETVKVLFPDLPPTLKLPSPQTPRIEPRTAPSGPGAS